MLEVVPQSVVLETGVLHEFDQFCEVVPHVKHCPLLVHRHLLVEGVHKERVRLP